MADHTDQFASEEESVVTVTSDDEEDEVTFGDPTAKNGEGRVSRV